MILAVAGPPGSGKTTVAERWAAARGYVLVSAGMRFRAMAKERGISLEAFGKAVLAEILSKESSGASVVVDGRIQGYLLAKQGIACIKVLIDAPLAVRAQRIATREGKSVQDAKREIVARERSERVRYRQIYGIDLRDTRIFDLVLDSGRKTPDEIVAAIAARVGG